MTKKTRSSKSNGRKKDPNQDVQPWLGWIAAFLVVVIVVVSVAMGMARTNSQLNGSPEVRMTPLVGGIEVPVATETGDAVAAAEASEVTPMPEGDSTEITSSDEITLVTLITMTAGVTETDAMSTTDEMTSTAAISATTDVTSEVTLTEPVSATEVVTATDGVTVSATSESTVEASAEATSEATPEATETATPRPTATTRPTATPILDPQVFAIGDTIAASSGRVGIHADAAIDALTLDTVGPNVSLVVMAPSGDFVEYPVIADGHGWVRVRAADGLVGWVMTDQVEAQ